MMPAILSPPPFVIDPDADNLVVTTAVPVDDQFFSPKQIRWSASLGKLLVATYSGDKCHFRNADLSFFSKYLLAGNDAIDSDADNIYVTSYNNLSKRSMTTFASIGSAISLTARRMIDASGDPLHIYATTYDATEGHGVKMVDKATMTITVVGGSPVQILSTGTTNGKFTNPLGVFFVSTGAGTGNLYICEATRVIKLDVVTTIGSESLTWNTSYAIAANDLCFDGTNWYLQSNTTTKKYDASFNEVASTACVGYSITYIPDQGDGYGATLGISNNSGSCLYRRKCSDLSLINTIGSSGDGSSSLCKPKITGVAGVYQIGGEQISAASGVIPVKNGFSAIFEAFTPFTIKFKPTGSLSQVTAFDCNASGLTSIRNLNKLINITLLKLQNNTNLTISLAGLSSKLQTLYLYGCKVQAAPISYMKALNDFQVQSSGLLTADVDLIITDMYNNRAAFTDAAPSVNLNLTNQSPTGTAQPNIPADEATNGDWGWNGTYHVPLSCKAMAYYLAHGPDHGADAFNKWTMTIS